MPGFALDLAVELDERQCRARSASALPSVVLPAPRSPMSAMRLRRAAASSAEVAHQPEHDVLEPVLGQPVEEAADQPLLDRVLARIDELGQRHPEGARDAAQQEHRRVALARLELREIALGDAGVLRQRLARHAAPLARLADVPAHRDQEIGVVAVVEPAVAAVARGSAGAMSRLRSTRTAGNILHIGATRQALYVISIAGPAMTRGKSSARSRQRQSGTERSTDMLYCA